MNKKVLKIIILCCLVAALSFALVSCKLFGSDDDSGTGNGNHSNVSVEQMPVKGAIDELWFDSNDGRIKWTGVENSLYYKVTINDSDERIAYVNQLDSYYAQDFTLSVFAVRGNNTKTAVKTASFSYVPLSGLRVDASSDRAVWTAVEGATGYAVTLTPNYGDAVTETVTTTSYDLSAVESERTYSLSVRPVLPNGLVFSSADRIDNVRRIANFSYSYNGDNARFNGEPTPPTGSSETYTYHLQIGDAEEITYTERGYEYVPTETVNVSFYAVSSNPNVLRSEKTEFTIDVLNPIDDFTFDGEKFTWSPVDHEYVAYYHVVIEHNGVKNGYAVEDTSYTLNLTKDLTVGYFVTATVRPEIYNNAYVRESNPIRLYRRGSNLEMAFDTYENSSTEKYGVVSAGDNVFSLTGSRSDEAMIVDGAGFRLTVIKDGSSQVVDLPTEENAYTVSYGELLFADPGTYTVTASPLYTFGDDVVTVGSDNTRTVTITRAAPLTEADLYNHELKPSIRLKSSTLFLDEVVTKGDVVSYPTFGVGNYSRIKPISLANVTKDGEYYVVDMPKDNDSQQSVDYSVTVYPRAEKIAKWEYSRENDWRALTSYHLRALTGFTVHYTVNGTVLMNTLTLNPRTNMLTWEYGEEATTHIQLYSKDSSGTSHHLTTVTTPDKELSFAEYVPAGTFVNGGTLTIYILGDPENDIYSCGQARTVGITQLSAPVLTYRSSDTDVLVAKPDKREPMDTEGYRPGDSLSTDEADITGGNNVEFIEDNIGQEVKFRYRSWSSFKLDSPWATYTVTAPATNSSMTLQQTGKDAPSPVLKISWTAKDNYSQYVYSITGGAASSATVDEAMTPNLYGLLKDCGRNTFHIEVEAVGRIDGDNNVVYLQKKIVDDAFYTVNLEASRTKDGGSNDIDRYHLAFEAYASPAGAGFAPLTLECVVRNTNNAAIRQDYYFESANLDLTSKAEEVYNSSHNAYLAVSIKLVNDRSYLLGNKAFILNDYYTVYVQRFPNTGTPTYV